MKYLILVIALFLSTSAHGVSAKNYADDLIEAQQLAYMFGALEMAISIYVSNKMDREAACIREWFVNHPQKAQEEIQAFLINPDNKHYPAAAIMRVVIEKHCNF